MRLFLLLLILVLTNTKSANANLFLEYFLTMSYIESGMENCASVVERLGSPSQRTQFLRVIAPALTAIQSSGKNPVEVTQVLQLLEKSLSYCKACPSATFGMALVNVARNTPPNAWCDNKWLNEGQRAENEMDRKKSDTQTLTEPSEFDASETVQKRHFHQYKSRDHGSDSQQKPNQAQDKNKSNIRIID